MLLVLHLFVGGVFGTLLIHHIARGTSLYFRAKKLLLQYAFVALIVVAIVIYVGASIDVGALPALGLVGFFVSIGAYAQWGALGISPSRAALFMIGDDIIAMGLSSIFQGEATVLRDPRLLGSAALSLLAALYLARSDYKRSERLRKEEDSGGAVGKTEHPLWLYGYALTFSVFFGLAFYFMKVWALRDVSTGTFLSGWYGGALLGAFTLFLLVSFVSRQRRSCEERNEVLFTRKNVLLIGMLSIVVVGSLALAYWTYGATALVVVQPVMMIGGIIIPLLVGLAVLKEYKKYTRKELMALFLSVLGAIASAAVIFTSGG